LKKTLDTDLLDLGSSDGMETSADAMEDMVIESNEGR
jgi:hypothetical protein